MNLHFFNRNADCNAIAMEQKPFQKRVKLKNHKSRKHLFVGG